MELRYRAARNLLVSAAMAVVALGAWSASEADAPNMITPPNCEAPRALGLAGVSGMFSVDGRVRFCTVVQMHMAVTTFLPGTEQTVEGPIPGSLWHYNGSYTELTVYERTTVYSQVASEPIQETVTYADTGERLEGWTCQRELRAFGIILQWADPDRPASECVAAGVYVGLPQPPP